MFLKWCVGSNIYHGMYRTGREMEQSELDYWRNPMLLKLFYSFMDIFTVFSTFDIDKLGKICQCYWKKCLNISKIAKYQSDTTSYVLNRDIVRPFWQIRTRVHMVAKSSYKVTFLLSFNTYLSSLRACSH